MRHKIVLALFLLAISAAVAFQLIPPIPQDPSYHLFADDREFLRVPNFFNVASNFVYLVAGLFGLLAIRQTSLTVPVQATAILQLFFGALIFVAISSAYYHLEPTNSRLVLDRLGMSAVFACFTCLIISDFFSEHIARRLLAPLVVFSGCTVLYWYFSETSGQGDLRLYGLTQFLPMLAIPFVLLFATSSYSKASVYWLVLALYVFAKLFESFDSLIYDTVNVSGHTLKHLISGLAPLLLIYMLSTRDPEQA